MPLGGSGVEESRVRLTDINTRTQSGWKYKLLCHFKLAVDMEGVAQYDADGPAFLKRELVGFGQSSSSYKWTGVQSHILRAPGLFLQSKWHYILYTGVGTSDWGICS